MTTEHQAEETNPPNTDPQEPTWTGKKYRKFMDYVAFRDDDPTWMLGYKLALRFLGILFMIILSPFLILGLFLAFIAAS